MYASGSIGLGIHNSIYMNPRMNMKPMTAIDGKTSSWIKSLSSVGGVGLAETVLGSVPD